MSDLNISKTMGVDEVDRIRERYARRVEQGRVYDSRSGWMLMMLQELERALIDWIAWARLDPVENKRVLEVGCGTGTKLLQLLRLGFRPENLVGIELLEASADKARRRLPGSVSIIGGDAAATPLDGESFDVVFQSAVFTSILDAGFRRRLAAHMWRAVRPGGGILWYDFVYDNPSNPDVRGIRPGEVQALFPGGQMQLRRITLAPPISRTVCRLHRRLYTVFNACPLLRTHVLCWIPKPARH
jgi:SAM-dependent methyltransferase